MRVTDDRVMNVVEMVLGELNQEIVGLINQHGGKAVGLTGQDGAFIHARKMLLKSETRRRRARRHRPRRRDRAHRPRDHPAARLARFHPGGRADRRRRRGRGLQHQRRPRRRQARRDAAGREAGADDQHRRRARQERHAADRPDREPRSTALFADGTIHGGMLPKIGSALDAVKNGVKSSHIIDGRVEHALLLEVLTNEGVGTMIRADDDDPRSAVRRADGGRPARTAHGCQARRTSTADPADAGRDARDTRAASRSRPRRSRRSSTSPRPRSTGISPARRRCSKASSSSSRRRCSR